MVAQNTGVRLSWPRSEYYQQLLARTWGRMFEIISITGGAGAGPLLLLDAIGEHTVG